MGYTVREGIDYFQPDDTDKVMYLISSNCVDMEDLTNKINEKWPGVEMKNIEITAEHIHTSCLTYDLHNSSDYTDFIVVTNKT